MQYAHQVNQGGGSMVILIERILLDHRPLGVTASYGKNVSSSR